MADGFELTHFHAHEETVLVEIRDGYHLDTHAPGAVYSIKPPLSEYEHEALAKEADPKSKLGQLLVAGTENISGWLRIAAHGEPNQENFDLGIELAQAIITHRGVRGGRVTAAFDQSLHQTFVTVNETKTDTM